MVIHLLGGFSEDSGGEAHGIGLLGDEGFLGTIAHAASPTWVAVRGDHVYAVGEAGNTVSSWHRAGRELVLDRQVAAGGEIPCHVSATADALYVSCYGDGVLTRVPLDSSGAVAADGEAVVAGSGSGPHPDQTRARIHSSLLRDDGTILVADLGSDAVHVYDSAAGAVTAAWSVPAGTGPRDLALLPDGRLLVLGELSCTLVVLGVDGAVQHVTPLPGAEEDDHAAALALVPGPDGVRVYSGLRGSDRVAIVDVPEAGEPRPVRSASCGGQIPRHLTIDVDAVLVANQGSSSVTVLDAESLELLAGPFAVPSPALLLGVPDDWAELLL